MDIAFCCDRMALAGLHVTLHSLLASNPPDATHPFNLVVIHEDLTPSDCEGLRRTVGVNPSITLAFQVFSTDLLRDLPGLHGNYMTYCRLFLAELLPKLSRVLYLDSDLLINCSLAGLWKTDIRPHTLGAVSEGIVNFCLEKDLLLENGLSSESPYLNAGVLLIDLERWRDQGTSERALEYLRMHGARCASADQSVLNAFFAGSHHRLPGYFNDTIYPFSPPLPSDLPYGIIHFVGGPKPWDLFGKTVHGNGYLFHQLLARTSYTRYSGSPPVSVVRILHLLLSYWRAIKARLNSWK